MTMITINLVQNEEWCVWRVWSIDQANDDTFLSRPFMTFTIE